MRKLIALAGLVAALLCLSAPSALARPAGGTAAGAGLSLPIYSPASSYQRPPGFTSNALQAMKGAEANRTMLAIHAHEHPLFVQAFVYAGQNWFVDFSYRGKRVAEVVLSPAGRVTGVWTGPLAIAPYARGDFAPLFGSWWVLVPFSLLFLVPFLDLRRPWRLLHLDALVLLSLLASYLLFDHAQLEAAVWLIYPPLLYLAARMLWIGSGRIRRRRGKGSVGLSPLLSVRVLAFGLVALVAARIGLSLAEHTVIDVGYASVIGAHRIVDGQSLYYASAAHGDTYGPIAYLAYVPFELLFPWHGQWDYLASAHVASIAFDLVTILGLVALGRRLRAGRAGLRLGLALAWAWAACPFTLLALMMHSNDGLVAMLSVLSLLAFSSPVGRGALLGLAAAAKFAPAALLPLFAGDRERGPKAIIACVVSFAIVVITAIALFLPSGGLSEFYNHTLGYQLTRSDVFSAWALHPSLDPLKVALEAGALVLCALLAVAPARRSLVQVAALAGALTIALQLPAVHWFYYFIVWFAPFVLVALLAREEAVAQDGSPPRLQIAEFPLGSPAEPAAKLDPVVA